MATNTENANIAVLQSQMKTVLLGIDSINKKLDEQADRYVTRPEFEEFKKRWAFSHVIVGLVSSILTTLIVYFVTKGGK